MKQQTKLSQEQQSAAAHQGHQQAGREFASAEELLRYDAGQTAVPGDIAQRLKKSTGAETTPDRPWWQRFFGGKP